MLLAYHSAMSIRRREGSEKPTSRDEDGGNEDDDGGDWRRGAKFGSLVSFVQLGSGRMRAPQTMIGVRQSKPHFLRAPTCAPSATR
jgi:hypothetical protein